MANTKEYKIQINGLTESINAVDALNRQLDALKQKIDALSNKTVNVGAKASTSSSSGGKSTSEEAAVQREINKLKAEGEKLDAKIVAAQDEIYKRVDATKQLYKETVADQKAMAAEERLIANTYSNTMQGMKSHLADLKAAINATDLGDSDKIKKMTQEANELTQKLKEMEQAYGTFGRNVGNYASAADGFKGLRYEIAGTIQEFDNAKQALKTFQGELRTLQVKKDNGMLLSEEELKRFEELPSVVAHLKSSIQDAGKPMDALMDTMQSLVAMAQVSKGFSAFFGFDDSEIQKSIQQLLALQNALQGLQTIQKQLQSGEFLGGIFKSGDAAIKSTDKLLGVDKAAKTASASVSNVGTAGKAAATGLTTASVAAKTTAKSFSVASAAATALRAVLNALGIGLVVGAIALAVEGIGKLIDKQQAAKKYQEELNNAINEGNKEYAKASLEMSTLEKRLNSFNGNKKQEKKLVEELNRKYGDSIGQYKSVKEWKEAIIKKAAAYAQALRTEAEAQALLNIYTKQFIELEEAKQRQENKDSSWIGWLEKAVDTVAKGVTKVNKQWGALAVSMSAGIHTIFDDNIDQMQADLEKTRDLYGQKVAELQKIQKDNKLFDYSDQIDKNTNKTKDAVEKAQEEINKKQIDAMRDGLNKTLMQLDEEERQTINKIKKNGQRTASEIAKVNQIYGTKRTKAIVEFLSNTQASIKETSETLAKTKFEINIKDFEQQIKDLEKGVTELEKYIPFHLDLETKVDVKERLNRSGLSDANKEMFIAQEGELKDSFNRRLSALKDYYNNVGNLIKENIRKQGELENKAIAERWNSEEQELNFQFEKTKKNLEDKQKSIQNALTGVEKLASNSNKEISEKDKETFEDLIKYLEKETNTEIKTYKDFYEILKTQNETAKYQLKESEKQYYDKREQILKSAEQEKIDSEKKTNDKIAEINQYYYDTQLANYRDFISKLNDETAKNPVTDKAGWGVVMALSAKKNYREIIGASETTLNALKQDRMQLTALYANGFIPVEYFNSTLREIDDIEKSAINAQQTVKEKQKMLFADFVESIQTYLQVAIDSFNTIMNAVWNAQDVAFDKEQEQLDKDNEELKNKLDEQEKIISQHKSAVESIEDELATSRGDRRQHLIDQLNAEIEAERRAAAEKKRIEKEQEAAQKKQDELDKKRKKAEYNRQIMQAIVNGAMAVTMASINYWPIPAAPLMALAASTTAAQVAIMKANKPYASGGQLDGGVAVGNRHRDGGIKVLGGRAEIEGGEFITNRISTQMNAPLLEFINSKKKRIDVSDLLEFYSSGSVKKNISSVRTRFADGGYIPTLPDSLDVRDQLQNVIINQDNRPIYVSVVDINNKQDQVRRVQTLAGLVE